MSRISLCFFVLFVFSIALFGDCEDNDITPNIECDPAKIEPGSDKTKVAFFERSLQIAMKPLNIGKILKKKNNSQFKNEGSFSNTLEIIKKYEPAAIYPGTRWCGDGDKARDENDLGYFKDTDKCCRSHDKCNYNIEAGATKVNLINNGIFTRSACSCDLEFYTCLKNANSWIASRIGRTYFNLLKPQCFNCTCSSEDCNLETDEAGCMDQCPRYQWVNNNKF